MNEVSGGTIVREKINDGEKAKIEPGALSFIYIDVLTTMYSCPNCHVILGIAQHTSFKSKGN
jgi:hypothetical protein